MKKLSLSLFLSLIFCLTSPNASEYNIEKKLNNFKYNIVLFEDFSKKLNTKNLKKKLENINIFYLRNLFGRHLETQ